MEINQGEEKKEFLKNICAYEQKLILLQSKRPYDVLLYLSEIDLKSSKLVLSELNIDEISKIFSLFTSENKKDFYNMFSELSLVNKFIAYDKESTKYIKDLPLERKIDLIDSSTSKTAEASSKVYQSIPVEERDYVVASITNAEAVSALSVATSTIDNETLDETNQISDQNLNNNVEQNNEEHKEEQLEEKVEDKEEQLEEKDEEKEKLQAIEVDKNEFLKSKIEYYKENIQGFKNLNMESENIYLTLSEELKAIIDRDFELMIQEKAKQKNESLQNENDQTNEKLKLAIEFYEEYSIIGDGQSKASIVSNPNKVSLFDQAQKTAEQQEISMIQESVAEHNLDQEEVKTI